MVAVRSVVAQALVSAFCASAGVAQADPLKSASAGWPLPPRWYPSSSPMTGSPSTRNVSYSFEPIHFQGSPLQITALQSGDLDIAALGFSSFSLAVENAGMADLRIIADETQWGVRGHGTANFVSFWDL